MKTVEKNAEIISLLEETESIVTGHFELSSGLHSNKYFQCARLFQYPEVGEKIALELAKKIDFEVDTVVGPALGGIIIGYEVARAMGKKSIFAERKNGELEIRRGFNLEKGEKVLIVEDVITTAKSALETAEVIKNMGGEIAGIACIVDRSNGKTGIDIKSLVQMTVETFSPEACPLCQEGYNIEKPGSRVAK